VVHLLNGGGLPTLQRCRDQYRAGDTHLGRLARPRHIGKLLETLDAGFKVGVDNDAFCNWDLPAFVRQIGHIERAVFGRVLTHAERISALASLGLDSSSMGLLPPAPLPPWHENLLFVTVPDVPFDAAATARRFAEWAPLLSHLPLALCVQDGAGDVGIPWSWPGLRCLFMAGSDAYKCSTEMAEICREGKRRGLWIHGGRVNSRRRIRYMLSLDCVDSIDGTGFDKFRDTHLGWGLHEASSDTYQLALI
jgi:hypothetical protein